MLSPSLNMHFPHLLLSVIIAISSCGFYPISAAFAQENVTSKQIEIPIIWYYGSNIGMTSRMRAIGTNRDWQAFLKTLVNHNIEADKLLKIDFNKSIVIAYLQSQSSGCSPIPTSNLLRGTLKNTGDLSIEKIFVNSPTIEHGNISDSDVIITGNCQKIHYRTTLYQIDRAGIKTIQGRSLSDYSTNPDIMK